MPVETKTETYRRWLSSVYYQGGSPWTLTGFDDVVPVFGFTSRKETTFDSDWKLKVRLGHDASHPYLHRFLDEWSVSPARLLARTTSGTIENADSTLLWDGGFTPTVGLQDVVLDDLAIARFRRAVHNRTKDFKSLVPLLEARDLHRTIRAAVDLTTTAVRTLLEIKRTKGRSAARYASKAWLTFNFGVSPILKDIDDLSQAIAEYLYRSDRVVRLKAGASKSWSESVLGSGAVTFNRCATARSEAIFRHTLTYWYVGGFNLNLKSANNYQKQFGIDLPSVLPALWEATAFSWVADYFGTVGAYLSDAFEAPPGVPVYLTKARLHTTQIGVRVSPVYQEPDIEVIFRQDGQARTTFVEFERTVLSPASLPRRSLRWKTSDEIGSHAVTKLLNLASLLVK